MLTSDTRRAERHLYSCTLCYRSVVSRECLTAGTEKRQEACRTATASHPTDSQPPRGFMRHVYGHNSGQHVLIGHGLDFRG
ncbi:Hypp8764 [Branchiostoma lanceolatum]|uniref:Hypp8764 protein n=1 Tax=Branchiostoma lanceolatum TaxID=7740 RepID=A0A8J9ZAW7_BRALA|nr:Hypp8764 [Branchiostoma lanceolatum]